MQLTPAQLDQIKTLRTSMLYDALLGNYKGFKKAKKEYAQLAVQDFDNVKKLQFPKATVPIFSKMGMKMLYVMVRDSFRIKTKDERLLKKLGEKERIKQKLNYQG